MGNGNSSGPERSREPSPERGYPGTVSVRVEVDVDMVERKHHTDRFDSDEFLITRRGLELPLMLHARAKLSVSAAVLHDTISDGSRVLPVERQEARRVGTELVLRIPAEASVGAFVLKVSGRLDDGSKFEVALRRRVVVLFSAWTPDDGVFLDDEEMRTEYVRNSSGRLYAGSLSGMPWNLALYRPHSLAAVLLLLKKSTLNLEQRSDPVLVCREMSAMVNVQGDSGVLVGNWSGDYDDGTSPSAWRGSGKILRQYVESKGEPVRYGQCWVFSGVLLSVLRVLGIPARSVTNFSSAHDTNRNRTIDHYYNEEGEKISYLSTGSDSVWNFHVWNEVWLARPDLPTGFGGWQALDATPQEESPQGGGYRTGPAPIKAVKDGNSVVYDTNFVIAEVNADIKKYKVGADGAPRLFDVDTTAVGKNISTKSVASSRRQDLTLEYKYPEGSDAERRALYHGHEELVKETQDMSFEIPLTSYGFGQDIVFTVRMSNRAKQHTVKGSIVCEAVTYTGRSLREISRTPVLTKVNKSKTETVSVTVGGAIFSEYPGTKVYLRFDVMLAVQGTSQIFSATVPVAPELPTLKIMAPARLSLGSEAKASVSFKNPLPEKMENVTLTVECDGLLSEDIEVVLGTIEGGAELSYPFSVRGLSTGTHQLVAGLDSKQVELVAGETEVVVVEGEDEPDAPQPAEVEVESVDLQLDINRRVHHTDRYKHDDLIVRRGQLLSLSLELARPLLEAGTVVARAVFTLQGPRMRRPLSFEVITTCTSEGSALRVELKTPADVAVGRYNVVVTVDNGGKVTVIDGISLIILFNPWSSEDTCYFPDTAELREYVLNSSGKIWVGTASSNYGRPWQFGQFSYHSLEAALELLGKMRYRDRSDPVKVSRHLSAMVNTQDDRGVLVGNWSGDYEGGVSPLEWTGSGDILAQYYRTKTPVRFAQCWVFSGVETTVLRTLGLPARSVSNFNSAHDTHFNRAIDKYFNEDGDEMETGDSIWNFHVWNEVWLARPDLPTGFGGWQALDSTPQEESPQGGGFRLGPCPVAAVKLGLRMNYDVEFVISEVNADIRYYSVERGAKTLTRVNTSHVGKTISTKAVGSGRRNDVTHQYKFPEGSAAERAALLSETEAQKEMDVDVTAPESTVVGEDFTVRVAVKNRTRQSHEYRVVMRGRAVMYTGTPGQLVKRTRRNITVAAGRTEDVQMQVRAVDYLRILEGGNFMQFVALVKADNDAVLVSTLDFRLRTPDIAISLPEGGLKLYRPVSLRVSFRNPLNRSLRNGKFELLGDGHVQDTSAQVTTVPPRTEAAATMETIPVKEGEVELVVRFTSPQLGNILGNLETRVTA